ncbi:MAG: hypothetical protein R3F61_04315 [Myxococcota bacterium]
MILLILGCGEPDPPASAADEPPVVPAPEPVPRPPPLPEAALAKLRGWDATRRVTGFADIGAMQQHPARVLEVHGTVDGEDVPLSCAWANVSSDQGTTDPKVFDGAGDGRVPVQVLGSLSVEAADAPKLFACVVESVEKRRSKPTRDDTNVPGPENAPVPWADVGPGLLELLGHPWTLEGRVNGWSSSSSDGDVLASSISIRTLDWEIFGACELDAVPTEAEQAVLEARPLVTFSGPLVQPEHGGLPRFSPCTFDLGSRRDAP